MHQREGEEGLGVEVCGCGGSSVAAVGFLHPLWWWRGRDRQAVLTFSLCADEADDINRFGRCSFLHRRGSGTRNGAPVGEHLGHKQCLCKTHFNKEWDMR
jgi:hypothetical protein